MAYAYDATKEPHPFDRFMDEEPDWDAPAEAPRDRFERLKGEAAQEPGAGTYIEPCKKCRGTGRFVGYTGRVLGDCRACKGKGKLAYRTSPEQRQRAKQREADRKGAAMVAWSEAHPDEWRWIVNKSGSFGFAASMLEAVTKYGSLTDGQMAAVQRCMVKDAERFEQRERERAEREAGAVAVDITPIETAFATAKGNGVRWPRLRLGRFTLKLASKGYVAVCIGEDFLGKIEGGKLYANRNMTPEWKAELLAICADPKAAGIAYGQRFGTCCVCGRELTNEGSIDAGIGPICAGRFGW